MWTKIKKLVESITFTSPETWDNPNGGYESTCPFCFARHSGKEYVSMHELNHKTDCEWLIACDLQRQFQAELSFETIQGIRNLRIADNEGHEGIITSADDIHNIVVEFDNGGSGIYCLSTECDEYEKIFLS